MLLLAELTLSKWAINYNILNTVSNSRTLPSMFKNFSIKIKRKIFYFSWDFGTKNTNKGASWHQILTLHLAKCYMFHRLNTENWIILHQNWILLKSSIIACSGKITKEIPSSVCSREFWSNPEKPSTRSEVCVNRGSKPRIMESNLTIEARDFMPWSNLYMHSPWNMRRIWIYRPVTILIRWRDSLRHRPMDEFWFACSLMGKILHVNSGWSVNLVYALIGLYAFVIRIELQHRKIWGMIHDPCSIKRFISKTNSSNCRSC